MARVAASSSRMEHAERAVALAEACLAALERLEPESARTLVLRGMLAWSRDDLAACQEAFAAAEQIAPNDLTTQVYLGRLYLRQRQWSEAERVFRHALEIDPDSAEAHYGLSVALPRQNKVEEDRGIAALGKLRAHRGTVADGADPVSVILEIPNEHLPDPGVVIDYQNAICFHVTRSSRFHAFHQR